MTHEGASTAVGEATTYQPVGIPTPFTLRGFVDTPAKTAFHTGHNGGQQVFTKMSTKRIILSTFVPHKKQR
jgi:hypothetical protein